MDYLLPQSITELGNCLMQLAATLIFVSIVQPIFLAGRYVTLHTCFCLFIVAFDIAMFAVSTTMQSCCLLWACELNSGPILLLEDLTCCMRTKAADQSPGQLCHLPSYSVSTTVLRASNLLSMVTLLQAWFPS